VIKPADVEIKIMHPFTAETSPWMREIDKQFIRGRQALLCGNVNDRFLYGREQGGGPRSDYVSVHDFLKAYFAAEGYELVLTYDTVDGLQTIDPGVMQPLLERILAQGYGGGGSTPSSGTSPTPSATGQPAAAAGRNPPGAFAADAPTSPAPPRRMPTTAGAALQPNQALDVLRTVLSQKKVAAGVIIRYGDKLFGDPQRQSPEELRNLICLKKMVEEAADLPAGHPLVGRKNALVIVAHNLGDVPNWLYRNNPLTSVIQATPPGKEERLCFFRRFHRNFFGAGDLPPAELEILLAQLADLTDGMTAWDLDGIRRTSAAERITLAKPRELVDYYKYGSREDAWESLDAERIRTARQRMAARVIGQPAAIDAVVSMMAEARINVRMTETSAKAGRPKGVFFFVGATGVGKTELAKAISELIFGDDTAFHRFDMSEYSEPHAAEKLTGSPPGYIGHEEGGQLTSIVRRRPYIVLLFDEIEKAHQSVMDKFLQILEDGRLTDGKGETVYFSQAVIIFTSNIGAGTLKLRMPDGGGLPSYDEVKRHFDDEVKRHFTEKLNPPRPELLGRFGENILTFDILRPEHIAGICNKFFSGLKASALAKRQLTLQTPDDGVVRMIQTRMAEGDNMLFGGRRIKMLLESCVERPLNRWIFFNQPPSGTTVAIIPQPGRNEVEFQISS
jgi:hypothetical protein